MNFPSNNNIAIFCKISMDKGYTWIQGIITALSHHNNSMSVFLSSKNFFKYANFKNEIIIKALDSTHENIYIGTINRSIINKRSHFLKIHIKSILSFYDKRKFVRFLVNYGANIKVDNLDEFHVKISDLSFGGLCFFSKHNLKLSSNILITINVTRKLQLSLYGTVIDKIPYEHEFRYSVKITPKSIQDQEKLNQVMDTLLLKQNGIKNTYIFHSWLKTFLIIGLTILSCTIITWFLINLLS
ncbi:MAG: PilZ domain-containing protein [Clostridiales bacterium]|nr:PilZ domain-containing protein [Clostridiales bacterium]